MLLAVGGAARYTYAMKTALVTGGSSGIGFCIASRLAGRGYSVTILDPKAPMVIPDGMTWHKGDVRDYHSPLDLPTFDVVVLNAAIFGATLGDMMAVNFFGNIGLIDRLNDNGHLIVIGSGGQYVAEVTDGVEQYLATKAALSAYCRGLSVPLSKRGIRVTEIAVNDCFDTAMGRQAGGKDMAPVSMVADAAGRALSGDGGTLLVDRNGVRDVEVHFLNRPRTVSAGRL